jgi:hypothetical protein
MWQQFLLVVIAHVVAAAVQCPLNPTTRVHTEKTISIATFNTEWLFANGGQRWKSQKEASEHISNIASIVSSINATMINLVEVESCDVMNRLITPSLASYSPYLIPGTDTATKQNVALLSRISLTKSNVFGAPTLRRTDMRVSYPIRNSTCGMRGSPKTTSVSKNYWTYFEIPLPGDAILPLILFSIHYKAIPTEPVSCAQREAQAVVTRDQMRILQNMYNDYTFNDTRLPLSFVLLGDFNDFDKSVPDKSSSTPTSSTFDILRDEQILNMTNVLSLVPVKDRYSHWWDKNNNNRIEDGELSLLDHILISKNLLPMLIDVKVHSDLYPLGNANISDHWPVSITLDLSKWRAQDVIIVRTTSMWPAVILSVLCVIIGGVTLISHFRRSKENVSVPLSER